MNLVLNRSQPFPSELFVRRRRPETAPVIVSLVVCFATIASGASWEKTVTATSPPSFPNPRPMHARYGFGWSGFPGATADIRLQKAAGNRLQLDLNARTIGLVRTLWKFDASGTSVIEADTLRPVVVKQVENDRSEKSVIELSFGTDGVTSKVTETPGKGTKVRRFAALAEAFGRVVQPQDRPDLVAQEQHRDGDQHQRGAHPLAMSAT